MDSLLANYASSDDEEQEQVDHQQQSEKVTYNTPKGSSSSSSIFSSLPPPKSYSFSSSIFSLPSPKNSDLLNPSRTLISPSSSKPNNLQKEEDGGDDDEDGDDGEDEEQQLPQRIKDSKLPSKFGGPVKPSLFSSFPEPKSSSSIFSALPPPKSHNADPFSLANLSSPSEPNPKKIVQVRLPVNPSLMKSRDIGDDDEEDDDKERERKRSTKTLPETPSVKSFLSSIPAPKNSSTLGALPSAAGSGRRSIIEADAPSLNSSSFGTETEVGVNPNVGNYDGQWINGSSSASLGHAVAPAEFAVSGGGSDSSSWVSSGANYENNEGYMGHGNYGYYGQYNNNWGDISTSTVSSGTLGTSENMVKMPGKRGRNDVPQEIVEVKQDELIKNRPREDQTRLTGIAFGPSYQPASTKGKPSKLHKRKHQIGSLFYDMKQKEMELAERRAKGFLTKAETQAKYGW